MWRQINFDTWVHDIPNTKGYSLKQDCCSTKLAANSTELKIFLFFFAFSKDLTSCVGVCVCVRREVCGGGVWVGLSGCVG